MAHRDGVETQSPPETIGEAMPGEPGFNALPLAVKAALEDQTDLAREQRYHNAANPWAVSRRAGPIKRLLHRLSLPRTNAPRASQSSSYYGDGLPNA